MKKNILLTGAVLSITAAAAIFGLLSKSEAASLSGVTSKAKMAFEQRVKPTQAEMETMRAEQVKKQEAVQAAISSGNYDAWVLAVGDDCPYLDKITKDNFSKLVEAQNLRVQADKIMTDLGIEKRMGEGHGFGMMKGEGRGMGRGMGFNK